MLPLDRLRRDGAEAGGARAAAAAEAGASQAPLLAARAVVCPPGAVGGAGALQAAAGCAAATADPGRLLSGEDSATWAAVRRAANDAKAPAAGAPASPAPAGKLKPLSGSMGRDIGPDGPSSPIRSMC